MNDRFWAKVLFKEFIRHYRKLDDAQIVADVRKSMDDLEDLVDDADSFGSKMVRWSMERVDQYPQARENGKKGGRPKKSPQDAPNGNAGVDMYDAGNGAASKSPTSCDQFTADGDIREDSQAKPDGSAITRNETRAHDALEPSANNYGDAATREGADESDTFSGADFTARQCRQVSATADVLVNQTRAGAGAQALAARNLPRNKEEVRLFAIDNGLDVDDANDWAEMNLRERHGRDKDGKPIRNWKGAILNYCKAMAAKRETA